MKKIANQYGWLIVLKVEESTKFRSQPVSAGQQKNKWIVSDGDT